MDRKTHIIPFILIGIIIGTGLSYFSGQLSSGFLKIFFAPLPKTQALNLFFFYTLLFYGWFFLLAYPHSKNTVKLSVITLIPAALVSIPYYFFSSFTWLLFFATCAVNSFSIAYQASDFSYPALFRAAYNSIIQSAIALFFTLLSWLILYLCGRLFALVQFNVINHLINQPRFTTGISVFFFAIGLYIATLSTEVVNHIRTTFTLICRFLFIPLSVISILFMAAFAFAFFHHTASMPNQSLFCWIAFLSVFFLNGAYHEGSLQYPAILCWICRVFLWISPVFSLIALDERLNHPPLNASHIAGIVLLFLYNLAYAVVAMGWQKPLLKPIEKINSVLAVALIIGALFFSIYPSIMI